MLKTHPEWQIANGKWKKPGNLPFPICHFRSGRVFSAAWQNPRWHAPCCEATHGGAAHRVQTPRRAGRPVGLPAAGATRQRPAYGPRRERHAAGARHAERHSGWRLASARAGIRRHVRGESSAPGCGSKIALVDGQMNEPSWRAPPRSAERPRHHAPSGPYKAFLEDQPRRSV
jgi:hypothetical protein